MHSFILNTNESLPSACDLSSLLPSHEVKSVCTQACMHTSRFKLISTSLGSLRHAVMLIAMVSQIDPCSITSAVLHKQSKPTPDLFHQCTETLISTQLMWHVHPQDNIVPHYRQSQTEVYNERLLIEALCPLFISG